MMCFTFFRTMLVSLILNKAYLHAQNEHLLGVALISRHGPSGEQIITGYTQSHDKPLKITLSRNNDARQTMSSLLEVDGMFTDIVVLNFPMGTEAMSGKDGNGYFLSVSIPDEADIRERTGAFSFDVSNEDISVNTVIIVQTSSATIVPEQLSMTVGIGQTITITMSTAYSTSGIRWRHDYGDILTEWNGMLNVKIDAVRLKDQGIYECYDEIMGPDGNHGVMRLIVRECPSSKWNPPHCNMECPVCYNGGVCDDITGACVCLPGFNGSNCQNLCSANTYGTDCLSTCSGNTCTGVFICQADLVGCSCANGYGGDLCTETCKNGRYGAGCNQVCNCDLIVCDAHSGCTGSCHPRYTGPRCQELQSHLSCSDGTYGAFCNLQCHCSNSQTCTRRGVCGNNICDSYWHGSDCSLPLAVLSHPPLVVARTQNSLTIDFTWSPMEDYGVGEVIGCTFFYYTSSNTSPISEHIFSNNHTITVPSVDTHVSFYVEFFQQFNGITPGPSSPIGTALTKCSEPLDKPTLLSATKSINIIAASIQGVPEQIERIGCDEIVNYEIRYISIEGTNLILEDYEFHRQLTIPNISECVVYALDVRVTNNNGFKGPWSDVVEVDGDLPAPIISNWSYTNDQFVVIWQSVQCSNLNTNDIQYIYEIVEEGITRETDELEVNILDVLDGCTRYTFSVYAYVAGLTGQTNYVSFTTSPLAPTFIRATVVKDSSFNLTWTPSRCSEDVSLMYSYILGYRNDVLFEGWTLESVLAFDKNITSCTEYTFTVFASAYGVSGQSSNFTLMTKPSAPVIDSVKVNSSAIHASWSVSNSCAITQYYVLLSKVNDDIVINKTTTNYYIVFDESNGISTDTHYMIKVAASSNDEYSAYSEPFMIPNYYYTTTVNMQTDGNSTTLESEDQTTTLVGGDIIAIAVGSALVVIIVISCIRIARSRSRHKDDQTMIDLGIRRESNDEYSTNSTTHDTVTDNSSSNYK